MVNKPIIILGAPRSGTKMLRGIFSHHPDVASFPSEIEYIWRYGNETHPTDELSIEHARSEVKQYIRKQFAEQCKRQNKTRIVEKTCSNTLRVDFVHSIFPEAYFVHIIRDGRASAESARRQWEKRPELNYYLQKLQQISIKDALYYATRYIRYHQQRNRPFAGRQIVRGPQFAGLEDLSATKTALEVYGIQWQYCVQAAENAINKFPPEQTISVRYEEFVQHPVFTTQKIFDKVGLTFTAECRDYLDRQIYQGDINKWRTTLLEQDLQLLLPHIKTELLHQGYQL